LHESGNRSEPTTQTIVGSFDRPNVALHISEVGTVRTVWSEETSMAMSYFSMDICVWSETRKLLSREG